jgi:hypothetical protein
MSLALVRLNGWSSSHCQETTTGGDHHEAGVEVGLVVDVVVGAAPVVDVGATPEVVVGLGVVDAVVEDLVVDAVVEDVVVVGAVVAGVPDT